MIDPSDDRVLNRSRRRDRPDDAEIPLVFFFAAGLEGQPARNSGGEEGPAHPRTRRARGEILAPVFDKDQPKRDEDIAP